MNFESRPNVLLITVDCLRPDFLPCYDSSKHEEIAPTISRLCASGTKFENAFANASQTAVSFPSIFTANYPLSLGGPHQLSEERTFVSEWFSDAGYRSVGFSTNHWLSYTANYPTGFDDYFEYYGFVDTVREHAQYQVQKGYADGKSLSELEAELGGQLAVEYENAIEGCETYLDSVDWESDKVESEYEQLQDEKELLETDFASFVDELGIDLSRWSRLTKLKKEAKQVAGHSKLLRRLYNRAQSITPSSETPRDKPMTDAETVTDDAINYLTDVDTADEPIYGWVHYMDAHRPYIPGGSDNWENNYEEYLDSIDESVSFAEVNDQQESVYEALYKACIRYIDEQIERVVDAAASLDRETVVVLTADHGEEFREHGGIDHNAKLYDELIRVPLVVSELGSHRPEVRTELISHVDLLPTVYGELVPDAKVPESIDGQHAIEDPRSNVLAETLRTANSPENPDQVGRHVESDYKRIAARTSSEKQIYYEDADEWQYFDLQSDGDEQEDQHPDAENERLKRQIRTRLHRIDEDTAASVQSKTNRPDVIKDRLEDLGYKM